MFRTLFVGGILERYQSLSDDGMALISEGKFEQARSLIEESLILRPNYAVSLNRLGIIEHRTNNAPGALNLYKQALHADPYFEKALFNLVSLYGKLGDIQSARSVVESYDREFILEHEVGGIFGSMLGRAGEHQQAVSYLRDFAATRPNDDVAQARLG